MSRAANYFAIYQQQLRGVVAEETYRQNMTMTRASGPGGRGRLDRQGRQLKADLLFVKLGGEERWLQFRDVFEVDRKPVRDRDQRLYKLFVDAKPGAKEQAAGPAKPARPRLEYEVGEQVRVVTGPFADFNGVISEIDVDRSKLKVRVNIFGRETPVELEFADVAKL